MPLEIVRNDITKMNVDAIVNSSNTLLIPGGTGVDASIHAAAGPELDAALDRIGHCPLGGAVITESFNITGCRYIIHTAGPKFLDGKSGEREILKRCYRSVLDIAHSNGFDSIAMPVLSSGAYGYPAREAFQIATSSVTEFFTEYESEMKVYVVVFGSEMLEICGELNKKVTQYITDNYKQLNEGMLVSCGYVPDHPPAAEAKAEEEPLHASGAKYSIEDDGAGIAYSVVPSDLDSLIDESEHPVLANGMEPQKRPSSHAKHAHTARPRPAPPPVYAPAEEKAEKPSDSYREQDLSFADMCIWWCDKKNIKKSEFYAKSNITKQTFWNMKNNPGTVPRKTTLFACVIGLRLNLDEAEDLLKRAGVTFSKFYLTDALVKGFIEDGFYDIFDINAVLYDNDQTPLGAAMN